jgi:leucyl-tRNA synthetase
LAFRQPVLSTKPFYIENLTIMPRYNPAIIEPKWQAYWEENKTFAAKRLPGDRKMYALDMFPYPSGNGLHVGHPEGYTATDIVCRYQRMLGADVMHPMGWDAFGLPAEQHAKKTGVPPRLTTEKNIDTFRRQLKMLGFSYDWDRELATTDVEYFRWTQHIFLVLFDTWYDKELQKGRPIDELPIPESVKSQGPDAIGDYQDSRRLAYQLKAPVNWCPKLGTVLSNEEVIGGLSERGGHPVKRIPLRQWMLRITEYADRLENDLEGLDWSTSIKALQRNWIGRSTGAEVDFFIGENEGGKPCEAAFAKWKAARADESFPEQSGDEVLRVYTTRPDTLFGATYMVIAPEHPFVDRLTIDAQQDEVDAYRQQASFKSDLDRTDLAKEKTGVFTGSYAINPVNGNLVPIWVADYVLISYGTGAIMAVPAHDTRDFEFALQFDLPITAVVDPGSDSGSGDPSVDRDKVLAGRQCSAADGVAVNSGQYDGLSTSEFKTKIAADLSESGMGKSAVNYKLRDWLFSRQHFWGEPFPILHELDDQGQATGRVRALKPEDLPVDLPKNMKFDADHASPEPPLDAAPDEWLYVTLDGKRYKRETNSMPQWAGSCWYYLRYLDPKNDQSLIDPEIEKAWMPVDLYVGGAEHAVLHLLYARFWHKVLFDRGYVTTAEPFQKLVNQGMILGEMEFTGYQDEAGGWVAASDVKTNAEGNPVTKKSDEPLTAQKLDPDLVKKKGNSFVINIEQKINLKQEITIDSRAHKMSKSRGNVVNPDEVVEHYGADALRLYEMFMGPLEAVKPWSMEGVHGVFSFLNRVWRMIVDERSETLELNEAVQQVEPDEDAARVLHKTIKVVTDDFDKMAFNTALARMMEFTNYFLKQTVRPKSAMETIVLLVAPFAPHMAEELWQLLGHDETLAYQPWPKYDEAMLKEDSIEIPVQIMGKLRAKIEVAPDADKQTMLDAAKANPRISELLEGKKILKEIVVPGRMVNFVAK